MVHLRSVARAVGTRRLARRRWSVEGLAEIGGDRVTLFGRALKHANALDVVVVDGRR